MTDPEQLSYRDILGYVQTSKTVSNRTMNLRLNSLTRFYDYLLEADLRQNNPVRRLRLKAKKTTLTPDLLTQADLTQLLQDLKSKKEFRAELYRLTHERDYLILILIIYQGVDATTLKKIEITDLDFEEGEIFLRATKRSNERTLKLQTNQILPFHSYVLQTRPKLKMKDQQLFSCQINNTLSALLEKIKKINPRIRNINQIRASVISGWLKRHHLRQVQYMAGHRYISSTEKYQQLDIEHLQESLSKYHPMG